MRNATGDFIWYELLTKDADAAQRFYGDVVGWSFGDSGMADMDYRMIIIDGGGSNFAGGLMEITPEMAGQGAEPAWLGYVGVDDVDAAVADWTGAGGSVVMPAMDIPNVGRMAMLTDPDGVHIYVMRGATDEVSTVFSIDQPRHVRWNEIGVRNDKNALDFYNARFGWTSPDAMSMGPMGDYHFLDANGVMMGALTGYLGDGGSPGWTFYIGVADIDVAVSAVTRGGGTITQGPDEIPGGEFAASGTDPQGARFGLVGPRVTK